MWLFKLPIDNFILDDKLKNILKILLISCFSLTIVSCGEKMNTKVGKKKETLPYRLRLI